MDLPYFELHLLISIATLETFSICTTMKLYICPQSTHSPFKGFKSIILSFMNVQLRRCGLSDIYTIGGIYT